MIDMLTGPRRRRSKRGQGLFEYALMLCIVVVVLIVLLILLGKRY